RHLYRRADRRIRQWVGSRDGVFLLGSGGELHFPRVHALRGENIGRGRHRQTGIHLEARLIQGVRKRLCESAKEVCPYGTARLTLQRLRAPLRWAAIPLSPLESHRPTLSPASPYFIGSTMDHRISLRHSQHITI